MVCRIHLTYLYSQNTKESFILQLLAEAREDELLSLSGSVLRRLERLTELQTLSEAPRLELRFAATAPAQHNSTLVGRLLTTAPDADKCVLNTEGISRRNRQLPKDVKSTKNHTVFPSKLSYPHTKLQSLEELSIRP